MSDSVTLQRIEAMVQRMAVDNAQLRADNRRLRKLVVNRDRGRILDRALDDATALLTWRFAGYAISRKYARQLGLSERRWEWARALLMAARIHNGDDITEPDFQIAVQRLATAHDRIMATGDIGALVIRRRKRETMRAPLSAPKRVHTATLAASD